jgi:very-short-patch-repair endonuclease/predicted DNA-binding transcriptional regulator AlpA
MGAIDDRIEERASQRRQLITRDELSALGMSRSAVYRRLETGRLRRLLPGVLTTAPPPDPVARLELAHCLWHPAAVVSHSGAAEHWGIRRAPKDRVEITVPTGLRVRTRAVVHYSNRLPDHHIVETIDGGRVTTVARTVFDLGGLLDAHAHLSIIEDARNKGLCTDPELGEVYADLTGRGRRGSAAWDRVRLLTARSSRPTMSELELDLQQALVESGLPPAVQQHPVELPFGRQAYIDLAYPDINLAIEIDHSHWHTGPSAVAKSNARRIGLTLRGWHVVPFMEHDIEKRIQYCVAVVRTLLQNAGAAIAA